MKVSLNWLREFTPIDLPIEQLLEKIGAQLGAIEEYQDIGKRYAGILVVKVIKCDKHPDAQRLSLCLIDDGGVNKQVKRDSAGLVQVVCGAPNVKAGMSAVWIPPGVTVPASVDKEPLVIEAREIRGQMSNGMLASAKELAIGESHEGLLELDQGKPGEGFAKSLWLDDYVIDIENKMFTHRPDCFGQLGVAREVAGITGQRFNSPDWYAEDAKLPVDGRKNVLKLNVDNQLPKLVPRFCVVAIKDVAVAPSPAWLQSFLSRLGVRPINNIVDITNFVMLATAQPLHAYDYDKLKSGKLGVRYSKKGEELELIGGKKLRLDSKAVVITDGLKPIGLGGVMGGAKTEVDQQTKNIVLEAATFDMNTTRRTAMNYGLFTDAATRFTKNQSPRQNMAALVRAVGLIKQLAGGRQASAVVDEMHLPPANSELSVSKDFINSRLGLELTASAMQKLLTNVEFSVSLRGESLRIVAPFWRTDIEIAEDIVEEVGRLYGLDKLPLVLPARDLAPALRNGIIDFKDRLRSILRQAGANEVLTYSFVHGNLLKAVGQDPAEAYQIANALSPDLQYYRLSLTPSLLEKIHPNVRAGFKQLALFELNKAHNKRMKDKLEPTLPMEFQMLSLVVSSSEKTNKTNGAAFFEARAILDYLAHELGLNLEYRPFAAQESYSAVQPYDWRRSAQVWDRASKTPLGTVGEYNSLVLTNLKLPAYTGGFEVGIEELMKVAPAHVEYQPLNRFPELEQDFCLRSDADLNYAELDKFMQANLKSLCAAAGYLWRLAPIDIYQRPDDLRHKQTTWRIILIHPERTLTTTESNKLLDELAQRAGEKLKAERI